MFIFLLGAMGVACSLLKEPGTTVKCALTLISVRHVLRRANHMDMHLSGPMTKDNKPSLWAHLRRNVSLRNFMHSQFYT